MSKLSSQRRVTAWRDAARKSVMFFGMSGLGKTYVSSMLRSSGGWFHYSIDYRIGTRHLGELIADQAKAEAMKVPFLREMLMSDSIYIASNISFENLSPVNAYLGKPGDPSLGGLPFEEYQRRQVQFKTAELAALYDTGHFLNRARTLYEYPHFICDTGGSICEWVDPLDENDPLMSELSRHCLPIWIQGNEAHLDMLKERFAKSPKPLAFKPEFLVSSWSSYLDQTGLTESRVDPDAFLRWIYGRALAHRQPRYAALARWGVTVTSEEIASVHDESSFIDLVALALERSLETPRPGAYLS